MTNETPVRNWWQTTARRCHPVTVCFTAEELELLQQAVRVELGDLTQWVNKSVAFRFLLLRRALDLLKVPHRLPEELATEISLANCRESKRGKPKR